MRWRRGRVILLFLSVVCVIVVVTVVIVNKKAAPQNLFEEIYEAEMHAARTRQQTVLSDTEYFHRAAANDGDSSIDKRLKVTVKESPKETSPYSIAAMRNEHLDKTGIGVTSRLIVKSVEIKSRFEFHGVDIELEYLYIISREGTSSENPNEPLTQAELIMRYSGSVAGRKIETYEAFESFGIPEVELKQRAVAELAEVHNYWVDNYRDSRLKRDEVDAYNKIVGEVEFKFKFTRLQ